MVSSLSRWLLIILNVVIMMSCQSEKKADMLVFNGIIYTADTAFTIADAMVIHQGKILDIGQEDELRQRYKFTEERDVAGAAVFPGFIDAHCHFLGYGILSETKADLVGCQSPAELVSRLKAFAEGKDLPYLEGRGWDQNLWDTGAFPDKSLLDSVFPDIPVLLTRIDGHAMLVNSRALNLAGITKGTQVAGGEILLTNGEPNGILIDNAMRLTDDLIPQPDDALLQRAWLRSQKDCFAQGLTMVADAGLTVGRIRKLQQMQAKGDLAMRIYAMIEPDEESESFIRDNGVIQTENLIVRSIKLYADGALGSRGALLLQPYEDAPATRGISMLGQDSLAGYCRFAIDHDYQLCIHAIGDSAVRQALQAYSVVLSPGNDLRWRVEHAQVVHPEDISLFGMYAIVPSVQATHATSDMAWAAERLGNRVVNAYAYKDLLKQNSWIPNGTDFPIEQISPLHTFLSAVYRVNTHGDPEGGFQINNALTPQEALLSITRWAAKACFADEFTGSLQRGKVADFVILDKDIMKIPSEELVSTQVLSTYLAGKEVFRR